MAERVGFEPTLPFRVNTLSKRAPSATRPSLRRKLWKDDNSGKLSYCASPAGMQINAASFHSMGSEEVAQISDQGKTGGGETTAATITTAENTASKRKYPAGTGLGGVGWRNGMAH